MAHTFRFLAGLGLIVSWAVSSLSAQVRGVDAPTPNGFNLALQMGERFTSNSRFQGEDSDPQGDYITDLGLNVTARRESARTDWSLEYTPNYTSFHQKTRTEFTNHNFDYHGTYLVSERATLKLRDSFFYSRDPIEAGRTERGEVIVLTDEKRRWRQAAEIDMDFDASRNITLRTGVQARVNRFEDPDLTDSQRYLARLGLSQKIGRQNNFEVTYAFSYFDLDGEGRDDSRAHGINFGWSRGDQTRNEVGVAVGVSMVDRVGQRNRQSTGSASYRHRFQHVSFRSEFRQDLRSDTGNASVDVARRLYAGLDGSVGKKLNLGVYADYGTRESVFGENETKYLDYVGASFRASWSVTPQFGLTTHVRHRQQNDSTVGTSDVVVNTFAIGVFFKVF